MERTTFNHKEIVVLTLFSVLLLVLAGSGIWWFGIRNHHDKTVRQAMMNAGNNQRNRIERFIYSLQDLPDYIAYPLGNTHYTEKDLNDLLKMIVADNDYIYGSTCAFEPFAFKKDQVYFAPYFYGHGHQVSYMDIGTEVYDYFTANWYILPKRLKRSVWTEPYYDEGGGGINMTTYTVPIIQYDEKGSRFIGAVTADMPLNWLDEMVESFRYLDGGKVLLISKAQKIISTSADMKDWRYVEIGLLAESMNALNNQTNRLMLREVSRKIKNRETGIAMLPLDETRNMYIGYFPLHSCDWSLVLLYEYRKT